MSVCDDAVPTHEDQMSASTDPVSAYGDRMFSYQDNRMSPGRDKVPGRAD